MGVTKFYLGACWVAPGLLPPQFPHGGLATDNRHDGCLSGLCEECEERSGVGMVVWVQDRKALDA